jgi:spore maturation protein CgeB
MSQYNYGNPARGEGYEFVNFLPTLRNLGHEVWFFDATRRDLHSNFEELNRSLLRLVEEVRPDVVLSVQTYYEIWLETWRLIRDSGIAATVNWATDDSWRYRQFSRLVAPAFDAFVTTYPGALPNYRRDGIDNVLLAQWATSADSIKAPLPANQCEIPVSFVGTAHGNRKEWVRGLEVRGIKVQCFGHGWEAGSVSAAEIPTLMRSSVISLNFANSAWVLEGIIPSRSRQIKARTFEVPGAGGFLLTEYVEGLDHYLLPDREVVTFRTLDQAAEKIKYFLEHTELRDSIARAGHERVARDHTYDQRLQSVLEFARLRQGTSSSEGNELRSRGIDWERYDAIAATHSYGRRLSVIRRFLSAACSAVFGHARGPRAARRLLYELSWRVSGTKTYTAVGLPGRMFYFES